MAISGGMGAKVDLSLAPGTCRRASETRSSPSRTGRFIVSRPGRRGHLGTAAGRRRAARHRGEGGRYLALVSRQGRSPAASVSVSSMRSQVGGRDTGADGLDGREGSLRGLRRSLEQGDRRRPEDPQGARGAPAQGAGVVGDRRGREARLQADGPRGQLGELLAGSSAATRAARASGTSGTRRRAAPTWGTRSRSSSGTSSASPTTAPSSTPMSSRRPSSPARAGADCSTDTKVVGHRLLQILKEENDWFWAFERLAKEVVGRLLVHDTQQAGRGLRGQGPEGVQAALHRKAREVRHLHRGIRELRPHRRRMRSSSGTSSRAR